MNLPSLFRSNNELWGTDPFRKISQLQKEMDNFFRDFQKDIPANWSNTTLTPTCDAQETDAYLVLSMDVPGMKKEDIKVELRGNQLSVSGERKEEKEEKKKGNYRSERFYGSYARTFTLPEEVRAEDIATEYKDGVLRIAIPKGTAAQSKQITVGESKPGFFEQVLKKDQKSPEVKEINKIA